MSANHIRLKTFPYVSIYVSYKTRRGKLRTYYHVRVTAMCNDWFRHGLPLDIKSLDHKKAERWAELVDEFMSELKAHILWNDAWDRKHKKAL